MRRERPGANWTQQVYSTSLQDYERQITDTPARVFGMSGFDPEKDIAGIILNRWAILVMVPVPGIMFGRDNPSS